jgi:hypothetical protein
VFRPVSQLYQLNTTNLNSSMVVSSATLSMQELFGSDLSCSDTWPVYLLWVQGISPSTDWNTQPGVIATLGTQYLKSASCGVQDVNFDVTAQMQTTAENNYTQWTFGLYGDESDLPDSSCSPSSEFNCGFMRFNNNPSITTVFDITPDVPSNTVTTPNTHVGATAVGCGPVGSTYGWVGATDLGANNGSQLTLDATVTSNITGEQVAAQYMIWNNMAPNNPVGSNVVANPHQSLRRVRHDRRPADRHHAAERGPVRLAR